MSMTPKNFAEYLAADPLLDATYRAAGNSARQALGRLYERFYGTPALRKETTAQGVKNLMTLRRIRHSLEKTPVVQYSR